MKLYTVGFIFDPLFERVVLMRKARPDWQRGLLNGVGGHIEDGEESIACMIREVQEETGLATATVGWVYAGKMYGDTWQVDVYGHIHRGVPDAVRTVTDEPLSWTATAPLPHDVVPGVRWVVPLLIDKLSRGTLDTFSVRYDGRSSGSS